MTTTVTGWLASGRSVDESSFTDLTTSTVTDIRFTVDGRLAVTFADDLPADVAGRVRRRIRSVDAVEEQLRADAAAQAAAINAWPDLGVPTLAKVVTRFTALTQHVQTLSRIVQPEDQ